MVLNMDESLEESETIPENRAEIHNVFIAEGASI